jgi:hypothetical protein
VLLAALNPNLAASLNNLSGCLDVAAASTTDLRVSILRPLLLG